MDAMKTVNEWLQKIAPGDAGMALNPHGQCLLHSSRGEQCIVYVAHPSSTEFHLFQDLVPLSQEVEPSIYEEVLKLNLPAQSTRGGAIGLDPQTRNLVFSYSRDIALTDAKIFCAILENFLEAGRENGKRIMALLEAPAHKPRNNTAARLAFMNR